MSSLKIKNNVLLLITEHLVLSVEHWALNINTYLFSTSLHTIHYTHAAHKDEETFVPPLLRLIKHAQTD